VVLDDIAESLDDLLGIRADLTIFFFFFCPTAKPKAENPQGSYYGSAHLPVSSQPTSESPHSADDFLILSAQFLLPDRKNGLASVKALEHQLNRFFSHLFQGHCLFLQMSIPSLMLDGLVLLRFLQVPAASESLVQGNQVGRYSLIALG